MNLTPESERIARAKFERLHPAHRAPGKEEAHAVLAHPALYTDHVMIQCGCGYRWRYAERDLYGEGETPKPPMGPPPFRSSTMDFKRPGRK